MIPPYIDPRCPSPGERILFGRFRDDPETQGWVVFHSLGVSRHPTRVEGEADFIVAIPNEGILCLEVKSGRVSRVDGTWIYGEGAHATRSTTGPFRQASEAMHAVRVYVKRADTSLGRLLFWSGVLFTAVNFRETSPEWHPWQYADRDALMRMSVSDCCLRILRAAQAHVRSTPSCSWYDSKRSHPDNEDIKRLIQLLRADFECVVSPSTLAEQADQAIRKFTEEQFLALDLLNENKRAIFKGPAGTGKTLLALEAVRRYVSKGHRTLFTCYNRLLGHWLQDEAGALPGIASGNLMAGTFHRVLLDLSGLKAPQNPSQEFWSSTLPGAVIDRALSGSVRAPLFDSAVLDEAQDLITEEYLDVLDILLEGGLAGGRWVMFGDFERQAIYSSEHPGEQDLLQRVRSRSRDAVTFPLRVNCRNTGQIAAAVELASGMAPGYSRILSNWQGRDVEVAFHKGGKQQSELLRVWLQRLLSRHDASDIVVLSPRRDEDSCSYALSDASDTPYFQPLRVLPPAKGYVRYGTVHSFKGLESRVVVLTDVDRLDDEASRSLLYVGMTRARMELVVLLHERCRHGWLQILKTGLAAGVAAQGGSSGNA